MNALYDHDYFENGIVTGKSLYTNYQWLPELTIPMCADLKSRLGIKDGAKVLDYGCAKGYLVKAFRLLWVDAYGYDVSQYAISEAPHEISEYVGTEFPKNKFDWVIAKDVLEHLSYDELQEELKRFNCENLFVAVPLGENGKYNVPAYELDKTHFIKEPLHWWIDQIEKAGFQVTYARYQFGQLKKNWSEIENGNGFFIGRKA